MLPLSQTTTVCVCHRQSCYRYRGIFYVIVRLMLPLSQTTVCHRLLPLSQTILCNRQSHVTVRVVLLLDCQNHATVVTGYCMLPLESCYHGHNLLYATVRAMLPLSQTADVTVRVMLPLSQPTTVRYRQIHVTVIIGYCALTLVMLPLSQTTACTVRTIYHCHKLLSTTVRVMLPLSQTTACNRQSHVTVILDSCMLPLESCYRDHRLLYVTVE